MECNEKIPKLNSTIANDGVESSRINITAEFVEEIESLLVQMKLILPDDKDGEIYDRTYFAAAVDVSKFLKNMKGNALMRMVATQLMKSMDFEPKFPLKKVSFAV